MKWYVFHRYFADSEINTFNIFDHRRFYEDVLASLKKFKDKDKFAQELRRDLLNYYRHIGESEIILKPRCSEQEIKVDIYQQVVINWDAFVDYVWSHRKEVLNGHLYCC